MLGARTPFIDRAVQPGLLKLVEANESLPNGRKRGRVLKGPFGFTEKRTENGRIYTNELWENVLANPELQYLFDNRLLLGEADHPPGEELESSVTRTSHFMLSLDLDKENNVLNGALEVVPTACGLIVTVLIDYGWTPGVSSRGGGDEIKRGSELIVNPRNYYYYCHDIVVDPSCGRQARITESSKASKALRKLVESKYPMYTSADGDYDFFNGILTKFGVRMEAIRESVGDRKVVYSTPSEAGSEELRQRLGKLSEEIQRSVPGESLVNDYLALQEKYTKVVKKLQEAQRKERAFQKVGGRSGSRVTGNLERPKKDELEPLLGGTTSEEDGQLNSQETLEEVQVKSCTEGRGSRPFRESTGRDDFSEIRIGGKGKMVESVESKADETASRMVVILQKRLGK